MTILSEIPDAIAQGIAPLAHCPSCDLYLLPDEGCIHIPRATDPRARAVADPTTPAARNLSNDASADRAQRNGLAPLPFLHASTDKPKGQDNRA